MAGLLVVAQTAEISHGTDEITLLQIAAPANQRLKVKEISVAFKGTSNTASPVLVKVLRQTSAGTMSSLTPAKMNSADDETLQSTAQHTAASEPNAGTVLRRQEVHPQTGYDWQAPFGGEIHVPGGTRLGLTITAAAAGTAVASFIYEE